MTKDGHSIYLLCGVIYKVSKLSMFMVLRNAHTTKIWTSNLWNELIPCLGISINNINYLYKKNRRIHIWLHLFSFRLEGMFTAVVIFAPDPWIWKKFFMCFLWMIYTVIQLAQGCLFAYLLKIGWTLTEIIQMWNLKLTTIQTWNVKLFIKFNQDDILNKKNSQIDLFLKF